MRRRLLRILLNAATFFCLLLSLASTALWMRCKVAAGDRLVVYTSAFQLTATAVDRHLDVWCTAGPSTSSGWTLKRLGQDEADRLVEPVSFMQRRFAGVRWIVYPPDAGLQAYWTRIPLSLPAAAFAAIALAGLLAKRRRRLRAGLCTACGYDCRATPERCPECGSVVSTTATPAREGKGETEGV